MNGAASSALAAVTPHGEHIAVRWRCVTVMAILALLLAVVAGVWLWPAGGPVPARHPTPALTVSVTHPGIEAWSEMVLASGAVAAWQEASVGAQIGGFQLNDIRVNVGDQVHKGQILARLDPALLRADEVQLVAAQNQAQANRSRALSLKSSGAISDQDVLQYETAAETAMAQLAAKRLQLRYAIVRAPDDGVITARVATLGAVVSTGQELFRLIRRNRLEWRGELTAEQVAMIRIGQTIALSLPDGRTAHAIVRQIAPTLDDRSRLAIVYADIPYGSDARAGMYVTGQIDVGRSSAMNIPVSSVLVRDGRSFVFKIDAAAPIPKVVQQFVTVGRMHRDRAEITQGLRRSDAVVATGANFLRDGDTVRIARPSGRGGRA